MRRRAVSSLEDVLKAQAPTVGSGEILIVKTEVKAIDRSRNKVHRTLTVTGRQSSVFENSRDVYCVVAPIPFPITLFQYLYTSKFICQGSLTSTINECRAASRLRLHQL